MYFDPITWGIWLLGFIIWVIWIIVPVREFRAIVKERSVREQTDKAPVQ